MKYLFLGLALSFCTSLGAQYFHLDSTQIYDGGQGGSLDLGDIDNDGDLDLIVSGLSTNTSLPHLRILQLHLNDGQGNFSLQNIPDFVGISHDSKAKFADFDGDGDLDLLAVGYNVQGQESARLYENLGNANFQYKASSLIGLKFTDFDFADIDGDGDLDLFLSGRDISQSLRSDLYWNNGNWNFERDTNQVFQGLQSPRLKFADYDGDNDQDLICFGDAAIGAEPYRTKLYLNDGAGTFALDTNHGIPNLGTDDLQVVDMDSDGDLDLLLTGYSISNNAFTHEARIYFNNGSADFSTTVNTLFTTYNAHTIDAADINQDGELDIVIGGIVDQSSFPSIIVAQVHLSAGGQFSSTPDSTLSSHTDLDMILADLDGDGDQDLIASGLNQSNPPYGETLIYVNGPYNLNFKGSSIPEISIYPNPAKDLLFIEGLEGSKTRISIFNQTGQMLRRQNLDGAELKQGLKIGDLASGGYYIQIEDDESVQTLSFLIQ